MHNLRAPATCKTTDDALVIITHRFGTGGGATSKFIPEAVSVPREGRPQRDLSTQWQWLRRVRSMLIILVELKLVKKSYS